MLREIMRRARDLVPSLAGADGRMRIAGMWRTLAKPPSRPIRTVLGLPASALWAICSATRRRSCTASRRRAELVCLGDDITSGLGGRGDRLGWRRGVKDAVSMYKVVDASAYLARHCYRRAAMADRSEMPSPCPHAPLAFLPHKQYLVLCLHRRLTRFKQPLYPLLTSNCDVSLAMLHPEPSAAVTPPIPHDVLTRICRHLVAQIPPFPHPNTRDRSQHDTGSSSGRHDTRAPPTSPPPSSSSLSPAASSSDEDKRTPTLRASARATLRAILLTGWHGYHAALPYLYANIEGTDLPAVCAGITPCADAWPEVGAWPNAASCARKLAALRWVRRLSVGSWPMLGSSSDDERNVYGANLSDGEYACYDALLALQKGLRLFPRLDEIVFHSGAMPWIAVNATSRQKLFQRIEESPLYALLLGERAAHVCIHLPPADLSPALDPEAFYSMAHYIGFTQHLLDTWDESPSTADQQPTLTIHNINIASPPVIELDRGLRASRVRLWPNIPSDAAGVYDRPWAANQDEWYELISWVWEEFEMRNIPRPAAGTLPWPRAWEIAPVRPIIPLTCRHDDDYAASAFWLRVLLRKDLADMQARLAADGLDGPMFDIDMPFWAATEPCGACGAHVDGGEEEQWWSAPLEEALVARGPEALEVGEQMKAFDHHGPRIKKGSCVSRTMPEKLRVGSADG